mmetsp:Transcript_106841/g.287600  ORF Transcript_106841/g.287600 Transcript_106841/m.287600 type:complete len:250 (+) Transcript_106841:170-919(+)
MVAAPASDRVMLNIGGTRFSTTRMTLLSEPNTYFHALLSSGNFAPDEHGEFFIDRNPLIFEHILDYWRQNRRDGWLAVAVKLLSSNEQNLLANDIEFYNIESLFWLVGYAEMVSDRVWFDLVIPDDDDGYPGFEVRYCTALTKVVNPRPLTVMWRLRIPTASDQPAEMDLDHCGYYADCTLWGPAHTQIREEDKEGSVTLKRPWQCQRVELQLVEKDTFGSVEYQLVDIGNAGPFTINASRSSTIVEMV